MKSAASPQAMFSASYLGFVVLLILRGTNGDTVTQTEGSVTLPEGTPLTLNCTYQSSYSVFAFWYVQYQNKEPKLLLKSSSENQRVEHHGFQASLKSDKSFHLEKRSVQTSDSAVYYCAVGGTVRAAAGGAERKPRGAQQGPGGQTDDFSWVSVLGWALLEGRKIFQLGRLCAQEPWCCFELGIERGDLGENVPVNRIL